MQSLIKSPDGLLGCKVCLLIDELGEESLLVLPSRVFSRARGTSISIGSNQLSKRSTAISTAGCEESGFVVVLVMAWSPVRRFNAG